MMLCIESAVLLCRGRSSILKTLDTMNKFEAAHIDNRHLQLFCDPNYILELEPSEGCRVKVTSV